MASVRRRPGEHVERSSLRPAPTTVRAGGQLDEVVGRPVTHRPESRESASRGGRGRRTRSAESRQGRAIRRDALLYPAQLPRRRGPLCTRRCPDAERGAIDRADISHAPSTLSDPSMPSPPRPRRNRFGQFGQTSSLVDWVADDRVLVAVRSCYARGAGPVQDWPQASSAVGCPRVCSWTRISSGSATWIDHPIWLSSIDECCTPMSSR